MATLIACADGNLNAANWAVVDTTSLLDSQASYSEINAGSWSSGSGFTPGAITIDGVAVKIYSKSSVGTYTMSFRLYNVTDAVAVAGTTITVDITDLPYSMTGNAGWFFFKFAATTLLAGKSYRVEVQESSSSANIYLYRDSTPGNFSRMLRTTTTATPAAGDILHILGEWTATATKTDRVITMDLTTNTDFGSGTDNSTALTISKGGTLSYGVAESTNYYLKLSGNMHVYSGGIFRIGTVANPIPRTSTAILEFDPVADSGMMLYGYYTAEVTIQGLSRSSGKNAVSCLLNTDEAAGQTELGVDTDTGWLSGDTIVIASTSQTYSQYEARVLDGDAAADHLHITAGLTNAHSGTSPTQAEIINITRNVKLRSTSSSIMTKFQFNATVDIDWAEFYYHDGILFYGAGDISYCSNHDTEDGGYFFNPSVSHSASYCSAYKCCISQGSPFYFGAVGLTMSYLIAMGCCNSSTSYSAITFGATGSFTYITSTSNNAKGFTIGIASRVVTQRTIHHLLAHSNSGIGVHFNNDNNYQNFSYITSYRNYGCGIEFSYSTSVGICLASGTYDNFTIFGNRVINLAFGAYENFIGGDAVLFSNCVIAADSTFASSYGVLCDTYSYCKGFICGLTFENCTFGVVSGIFRAHATADICISSGATALLARYNLINCNLASGAGKQVLGLTSYGTPGSWVKSWRDGQVAGANKSWFFYGIIEPDATYYHTATPSQKMTPNNVSNKLVSSSKFAVVASGATLTPHVWVRKSSVAAGGADYNGNQPRLIVKKNIPAGITSDTVLATMTAAVNTWEDLTGTTIAVSEDTVLEFVVDCDGTAGFINVDDWSV